MISDKQMCDFLFSMLAQLEVRNIDWDAIAKEHEISNAHAARMRWHRLKAQKTGSTPKARAGKRAREEGLETSSTKKGVKGDKSSLCASGEKAYARAEVSDDDDDDKFLLTAMPKRPKLEQNDAPVRGWTSVVKQEELDVKLLPHVWNQAPLPRSGPMDFSMPLSVSPVGKPLLAYYPPSPSPMSMSQPPQFAQPASATCYGEGMWTSGEDFELV